MCGIAAIFGCTDDAPPVDLSELRRMRDHMVARGPDHAGEWFDPSGRLALGHRRLAIIDLTRNAAQPMCSGDGANVLVFNGEIYNHRQLRAQLESKGHRFQSDSDTEVLLHLYAEKGEAMLHDLRGMYAFALWDARRQALFLARDPFGIKPLYYADDGRTLRVASQVKALLAGGRIDTSPSAAGHVSFFLWGSLSDPYTLYQGIRALPAGTSLWADRAGQRKFTTFCDITRVLADAEDQSTAIEPHTAREQLREALVDTVGHHLVADVPVGVFLSSGLDSTTIAALASERGGSVRTVTLGFEEFRGTAKDEVPLAEAFARHCGTEHQTVWVSRADFEEHRGKFLNAMDQPSIDGLNTYFVSLAARWASLKVALSGLGGDEIFAGYPSFREIPRVVNALRPLAAFRPIGRGLRILASTVLPRLTSPKYAGLLEYGGDYGGAYLLRRGLFMPWELPQFLDPDMVRAGWRELQPLLLLQESLGSLRHSRSRVTALESCWYMRHQLLRDSDWASMAHSIELRVPFVDLEFLRRIAPMLASAQPPGKQDMARTPLQQLPVAIMSRPKAGFITPLRDWLHTGEQPPHLGRGLRGWTQQVYQQFSPAMGKSF